MFDGLAKSLNAQSVDVERSSRLHRRTFTSRRNPWKFFFPVVHARPYIEKYHLRFAVYFPRELPDLPDKPPSPVCSKNTRYSLRWPVHGTYACRNVVFEPVGTSVSLNKAHADSA
jgi:hypothetical protein